MGLVVGLLGLSLSLGWLSGLHFMVRTLADQRMTYTSEVLTPAVARLPQSARLQKRLAEAWLDAESPDYEKASQHAALTVKLSPHSGRAWYLLGMAQDAQGLAAEAEQSLWQAAALAPADSAVNWALANSLVRAGKVDESVQYFRRAATLNAALYPQAFDTLWQAGGRKLELLQAISSAQPQPRVSLAQYLAEQKLYQECALIFAQPDEQPDGLQAVAALPQTADLLNQLLAAQQPLVARAIWLNLQRVVQPATVAAMHSGALWDGGFEAEATSGDLSQFAWLLRDSEFARVGYDESVKRSGQHSLKLLFLGRDSTVLGGELLQRLALQPGRRYRLTAYVKAEKLETPTGPRIVVSQDGQPLGQSPPITGGTADWQLLSFEFIAPASGAPLTLGLARKPQFAYDEPTRGTLWFDDFNLVAIEN